MRVKENILEKVCLVSFLGNHDLSNFLIFLRSSPSRLYSIEKALYYLAAWSTLTGLTSDSDASLGSWKIIRRALVIERTHLQKITSSFV
jgi:hypothetical protein